MAMNRKFIGNWANNIQYLAVLLLLFAAYNNRAIGAKYTGYVLAIICTLVLLWMNREHTLNRLKDPILGWLIALIAVVLVAITQVAPEYQLHSLENFRKEFVQAGVFAIAVPLAINSLDRLRHAALVLGLASLGITVMCFVRIAEIPVENPLINAPTSYRYYGFRYVFYFPFLWLLIHRTDRWQRVGWVILVAVQLTLMAFSGFRGAWLASAVMIALWAFFFRTKRLTLVVGALLFAALGAAALSSDYTLAKLHQTDTGKRWDGAWRASVDMIKDRPWRGHGIGPQIFKSENDRLADQRPSWALGKQLTGPHSIYLDVAFSAGIPALIVLLIIIGSIIRRLWRVIRTSDNQELRSFASATLCSIFGFYIVLGALESLRWELLGLFVGLTVSITALSRKIDSRSITA